MTDVSITSDGNYGGTGTGGLTMVGGASRTEAVKSPEKVPTETEQFVVPVPQRKMTGQLRERKKATSHHIGPYEGGRKEGFSMVKYYSPRDTLLMGNFHENSPSGVGTLITPPNRFLGIFRAGLPEGVGILRSPDYEYRGGFYRGVKKGMCVLRGANEERRGTFDIGHFNGYGEITRTNPDSKASNPVIEYSYKGFLLEDLPHGAGIETVGPASELYEGYFSLGQRHGIGQMMRGQMNYLGEWREGSRSGFGFETDPDYAYFGSLNRGVKQGIGEFVYESGGVYVGEVARNVREGFGKFIVHGDIYVGDWANDRKHGRGYSKSSKGKIQVGVWSAGIYQGNPDKWQVEDNGTSFYVKALEKIEEVDKKLAFMKDNIKEDSVTIIKAFLPSIFGLCSITASSARSFSARSKYLKPSS